MVIGRGIGATIFCGQPALRAQRNTGEGGDGTFGG